MSRGLSASPGRPEIEGALRAAVSDRLGTQGGGLVAVATTFDEYEGEDIAVVWVVIDPKLLAVDSEALRNLGALLRREMARLGSPTYPLVRVLSKTDYERRRA